MLNESSPLNHPRLIAAFAAALALAASLAGVNAYIGGGGDNAGYIAEAQSFRATGELREIFLADAPLSTLRPPLFPILLSGVMALFGDGVLPLKVFLSLCTGLAALAGSAAALVALRENRKDLPGISAGVVALWFALSPALHRYGHDVLSDVPFTLAALGAIACCGRFVSAGGVVNVIALLVFLLGATLLRTAGLIIGGALLIYTATYIWRPIEAAQRKRGLIASSVLIAALVSLALFTGSSGTGYAGHVAGEQSLFDRVRLAAQFYGILQPVEILGYSGLAPKEAVYSVGVFGSLIAAIGWLTLLRSGRRLIPIVWLVYQGVLLFWPFLDARFFLPTLPLFLCMAAEGAAAALRHAERSRPLFAITSFLLLLFPALGALGLVLQAYSPEVQGATAVEWICAVIVSAALTATLLRRYNSAEASAALPLGAFKTFAATVLVLLVMRAVFEEIIPERTRGPAPASAGYADLYDASAWLKDNAANSDVVVSSKASLVWFWSEGLRGMPVPKGATSQAEKIASAQWAIIDAIPEDRAAQRYLLPLVNSGNAWKLVWEQNGTAVFRRVRQVNPSATAP